MADFLEEGWQTMARRHTASPAKLNEAAQSDSSSVLEDFAFTVAHELATPLAIIHSAAVAALDVSDGSDAEQHELLEMIRRNSDLAALLLRRLALARDVEADDVTLTRTAIDLATLVTQLVGDLQPVVLNGHAVTVTGSEEVPVHADETALREIEFNLLSNAAKYSEPAAPIEVCVGTKDGFAQVLPARETGERQTYGRVAHSAGALQARRPRRLGTPRSPPLSLALLQTSAEVLDQAVTGCVAGTFPRGWASRGAHPTR